MTTHPAFRPRLARDSVDMLLSYLSTEAISAAMRANDPEAPEADRIHAGGEVAGLDRAGDLIRTMWTAAEIAAHAVAEDMTRTAGEVDRG